MDTLLAAIVTPDNLKGIVLVMLALFAKDVVVAMLRRLAKRFRGDKNPNNDVVADLADGAADGIEKFQLPSSAHK